MISTQQINETVGCGGIIETENKCRSGPASAS